MRILILLMVFLATSALAEAEIKVNRMEITAADVAEDTEDKGDDVKEPAKAQDYNSSRSNSTRSHGDEAGTLKGMTRDAASGLPTGKRQHSPMAVDPDSDGDSLDDTADACDDDCDSAVDEAAEVRKEQQEAQSAH